MAEENNFKELTEKGLELLKQAEIRALKQLIKDNPAWKESGISLQIMQIFEDYYMGINLEGKMLLQKGDGEMCVH